MIPKVPIELVVVGISVIIGVVDSIRQFRKKGRFRLVSLPLRSIRRLFYEVRRFVPLFNHPKPTSNIIKVDIPISRLEKNLAMQGAEPDWPLSYVYNGEDLNCRRYYYNPYEKYPHRQLHIRGWKDGEKSGIYAHDEPSPVHHPVKHLTKHPLDKTQWVVNNLEDINPRRWVGSLNI